MRTVFRLVSTLLLTVSVLATSGQALAANENQTGEVIASGYAQVTSAGCYHAWDEYVIYYGGASSTLNVNWCVNGGTIYSASSYVSNKSNSSAYYVYTGPTGWRDTPVPTSSGTAAYWQVGWDSLNSSGVCYVNLGIRSYPSGYWEVVRHYTTGQCAH